MAYTEEEKVFYLQKMWSEGLLPATAEKRWGRPSRESLRKWLREADEGKLPAKRLPVHASAEGHCKHARYSEETRKEALRLCDAGRSYGDVARILGIPSRKVVYQWVRKRDAARSGSIVARKKREVDGGPPMDEVSAAELERLRLENMALKELMLDPKASDPASLPPRQRAGLCERLRRESGLPLNRILSFLSLSKSTYEYHRAKTARGSASRDDGGELDQAVARAFAEGRGAYGYRRVRARILAEGSLASCPERKVRESMARQGLVARSSRTAKQWSSYGGEIDDAPPNLLVGDRGKHLFSASAPDERWVTDITEMKHGDGCKLYLSVIVDLFDGKVVAWRTSANPNAQLANSTLADALAARREGATTIIHSDRGAHYRWKEWVSMCEAAGLVRSMSKKGRSPDNAACEGFFGMLKSEMYHGRGWGQATHEELAAEIGAYIESYNTKRLKTFRGPDGRRVTGVYETIEGRRRRLGYAA